MSVTKLSHRLRLLGFSLLAALSLGACASSLPDTSQGAQAALPPEPMGLGYVDKAEVPSAVAYNDTGASNQRGKAEFASRETNAGVRVLDQMLKIWAPRAAADGKVYVDAGVTAAAQGEFPEIKNSDWAGIPGDSTDGKVLDKTIHNANIAYVEERTAKRSEKEEQAAYLDDRRGKSVSISDALGPLTKAWMEGTRMTTTITSVPADATTVKYDDKGINRGITSDKGNNDLGKAVDLVFATSADASTEPAKRYYKYARPYRWSEKVIVAPTLVAAKSTTPPTDGGFPSGHTAEAWRDALTIAWLVPQRYQEMVSRALVMGENRILAGMHSPLDVIGGRVMAIAQVAYNLNKAENLKLGAEAYAQTQGYLMTKTGAKDFLALEAIANSGSSATDPYADRLSNIATVKKLMAPGFKLNTSVAKEASVPKGAEILLATRFPYMSAEQRRIVLKTTVWPAGYPLMDDPEGWGRLDLFTAADGYGRFDGDVLLTMDSSLGGFNAMDTWRNAIAGAGKLTKEGSGTLVLDATNSYSGGTVVNGGMLVASKNKSFGTGAVYLKAGTLAVSGEGLALGDSYTQAAGTLELVHTDKTTQALQVKKSMYIGSGTLKVSFAGTKPRAGTTITLVKAEKIHGRFDEVLVEGFTGFALEYTNNEVRLILQAE